jgi:hypothetical protein
MRNKYHLHVSNKIVSMVDFLKDLLYIYKCREIITFYVNNSYNYSKNIIF